MNNWANRLKDKLNKLDILFDDGCTLKDAIEAWNEFLNMSFGLMMRKIKKSMFFIRDI